MQRKPIRKLSSDKSVPPRMFDLLIDEKTGEGYLETKKDHDHFETEKWEIIKMQVETALEEAHKHISA